MNSNNTVSSSITKEEILFCILFLFLLAILVLVATPRILEKQKMGEVYWKCSYDEVFKNNSSSVDCNFVLTQKAYREAYENWVQKSKQ